MKYVVWDGRGPHHARGKVRRVCGSEKNGPIGRTRHRWKDSVKT
jgi:hypothetical protein